MKFCYVDESGTGNEPFAVMAGVIVDAYRMRPTKEDWDNLLIDLANIVGTQVKEFHTKDFYAGNSPWRDLDGPRRAEVLSAIFKWYSARRHHIVFSVIDKATHRASMGKHPFTDSVGSLWQALALHVVLALQKHFQREKHNKGNTVLVFDSHKKDEDAYSKLILNPPEWTDTYYSRDKTQKRLDQIVDVPHFVDSAHVGMIQLADCISYILRRHIEISEGAVPPRYEGEKKLVGGWVNIAFGQSIPSATIYPKQNRCEAADYFFQLAPDTITR